MTGTVPGDYVFQMADALGVDWWELLEKRPEGWQLRALQALGRLPPDKREAVIRMIEALAG